MKKISRFLSIVLICLLTAPVHAQEIFKFNSSGGGFNFSAGFQGAKPNVYFENAKLGAASADKISTITSETVKNYYNANFLTPGTNLQTIGFQGFGLFNSILVGGELSLGISNKVNGVQSALDPNTPKYNTYGETNSRFFSSGLQCNVGVIGFRKRGFVAYPMLGLGYGASGAWLSAQNSQRIYPAIADVATINDPNQQNMVIWNSGLLLDLGLGGQFLAGRATEDNARGLSIGFRLGYTAQFASSNYKAQFSSYKKESNPGVTDAGTSGFYLKLMLGFARIGENR